LRGGPQDEEDADARSYYNPASGQTDQNAAAKPARFTPPISLCEELIMKGGNGFVVGNLLEAKLGSDALLQELQARPLEPGKKVERRQKYRRLLKLVAAQRAFIDVLDLPVGEPVEIFENE
jgi:hypothetical protein